ncbi:AraC family transcriptional regulator [Nakamurella deserti]|uniref:AraC family transcriptional regulator n=1 Tax=Nakamurella deserti TaxID=2164074 RepID=UPI000DBE8036|nr:AraC family transcriptional regulator [Nakamurella deserti]
MLIADGFPGQRLRVLPRPAVGQALSAPLTGRLLVTDAGHFPHAAQHGMTRPDGVPQTVVILCSSGLGAVTVDGAEHRVWPRQVVVLPAHRPHSYAADPDDPWTIWWLHVAGADVPELLRATRLTAERPVSGTHDFDEMVALVRDILDRMERDETRRNLIAASGAAWNLLALLAAGPTEAGRPVTAGTTAVEQARAHIRAHLSERVAVAELAAQAGFSTSHFAALFRRQTGCAVHQYQTQLRMAVARELLDTTDRPVVAVATAAGYSDSFYFARQFRAVHGMTASAYRAQRKG